MTTNVGQIGRWVTSKTASGWGSMSCTLKRKIEFNPSEVDTCISRDILYMRAENRYLSDC